MRTLLRVPMVKYEMLGLAARHRVSDVRDRLSTIRIYCMVWSCFVQRGFVSHATDYVRRDSCRLRCTEKQSLKLRYAHKKRLGDAPLQTPLGVAHDAPPSSKFPTLSRGPTLEAFVNRKRVNIHVESIKPVRV